MVIEAFRRPLVNLFDGLDHPVVSGILEQAQTQRLPPETLLFSEGEPARALHVLISGFVKMVQTTPNGERVITRYVKPGEAFGTPALLGGFYPADAVTATHCIELQWPSPIARNLAVRHPSVALNAIGDLEARLRDMESRLRDLSNGSVEQRIAHALTKLAEKFGRIVPEGIEIPFPLSRQDLADLAGTTLYTVSRTLGQWETRGRIKRGRRHVVVTDLAALALLAAPLTSSETRPRRTHRRTGGRSMQR